MDTLWINILIYNILVSASLLLLMYKNPRYMMQDYPKEITQGIPEKTKEEKRGALIFGLPFLLILVVYPLVFGIYGAREFGFLENWARIFSLMFSFNLVDFLILDWLLFCTITPKFMVLPGTEGHPGYKNYVFHFYGFLKGTVISAAVSALMAWIVGWF